MRADLGDTSGLDGEDQVRPPDGREPVRDHERGAIPHQVGQRILHEQLRFGVERRGRFVEDEQRTVLQNRARDGQPLALPAGEQLAALADPRRRSPAAAAR